MTAVSGRVAREVRSFAPRASFSLLPNAIDTAFWTPASSPEPRIGARLVYAGRLQSKKRPLLLLRVLRELAKSSPIAPWTLTIAGDGVLRERLNEGVRKLGLEHRVTFVGWTDRARLREILRASDIFLSTATRESFGLAALEARAVGVPVVGVRDSAVADFITDEESGLLASGDRAFAQAASRLVRDADLRSRIADFNRRTPVPYDWERALALHDEAYDLATRRLPLRRNG
jgi:glycosyltransferase involved in cell wall biosynthesis